MGSRLTILEELNEISPLLAGIERIEPYKAPDGYFESFAQRVMDLIRLNSVSAKEELEALSPLLSRIPRQVPYELPGNYFNELSEHALVGARAIDFVNEELENLSPLMNSLKGKNVYEAPAGYFEGLAENILSKAKEQPAKVIAIRPFKKIMRYAVAAVVIGVMALSVWLIQKPTVDTVTAKIENGIQKASDEEILNFIQNNEVSFGETLLNTDADMNVADMKAMLADISDTELEQFANESLEQNNSLSN